MLRILFVSLMAYSCAMGSEIIAFKNKVSCGTAHVCTERRDKIVSASEAGDYLMYTFKAIEMIDKKKQNHIDYTSSQNALFDIVSIVIDNYPSNMSGVKTGEVIGIEKIDPILKKSLLILYKNNYNRKQFENGDHIFDQESKFYMNFKNDKDKEQVDLLLRDKPRLTKKLIDNFLKYGYIE